jgi:glycosyltransferase involved in cell wall biosynthesis
MKSFFIIPVFNKEHLIAEVYKGIDLSVSEENAHKKIFIIDGCTDKSESILKEFNDPNSIFLYADNVHEIRSLNIGLNYIKDNCNPDPEDLIFTVQDDVILQEDDIDVRFKDLFEEYYDLGYVSMRLGSSISKSGSGIHEYNLIESEFGHWTQLNLNHFTPVKHNEIMVTEIAVRSPTCMQWKRYEEVGFYDDNLAPCGYDCHDISIRLNKLGYRNCVYALKYHSDPAWGTMREKPDNEYNIKTGDNYERNRQYLIKKHNAYFGGTDA